MKRYLLYFLTISSLTSLPVTFAGAEDILYVQPFRSKVYAKPSISSDVLGTVDSGFQFAATGKEGNWVKLEFKGKHGFIPAVQTAKTPPLGKSTAQIVETSPKLSVRSRTSSATAVVAGMKGLTYEDRARVTKGEHSDIGALDKVDALKISPEELRQFQAEGGKR